MTMIILYLYPFPAFLDLSLKMYTWNVYNTGYVKEQTEKGCKKEDRSYTHMCYDLILSNAYIDFINIWQHFGLKPYLTANTDKICPQRTPLLNVWCYKTVTKNRYRKHVSNIPSTHERNWERLG